MPDRTCGTPRCGNPNAPHRNRITPGAGYWCTSCLDHWKRVGTDPADRQALRPVPAGCPIVEDGVPCPRPVVVKRTGWCEAHRKLAYNNGSPTTRRRAPRGSFQAFVHAAAEADTDECLIPAGWGQRALVRFNGKTVAATRAVWEIAHGHPGDANVLHRCNGGSGSHGCINVRHLYLGDTAQNSRDMVDAERQARGEGHGRHVLTEAEVADIRRRHVPGTGPYNRGNTLDLADEYGVAPSTLRNAVSGRSWSHLDKGAPDGDSR